MPELDQLVPGFVTLPGQVVVDAVVTIFAAGGYIVGTHHCHETELSEAMDHTGMALYRAAFGSIFTGPADDDPETPLFTHCERTADRMATEAIEEVLA